MQEVDPSQYTDVAAAAPQAAPQAAPSAMSAAPAGLQPVNQSEFEQLPAYADGSTTVTPVNKSPLSTLERAQLSLGNDAGRLKYLKGKFEDATRTKDGDLLVKQDGLWHRVDAKGLGNPDPWETTKKLLKTGAAFMAGVPQLSGALGGINGADVKEMAGDVADVAGDALPIAGSVIGEKVGQSLGAAAGAPVAAVPGVGEAAAIGGSVAGGIAGSAIGAGAGEALRTSLGRLVGTYEATPAEQLKDVGVEALLNAGGVTLAAGAKPVFGLIKKGVLGFADAAAPSVKAAMAGVLEKTAGIMPENAHRLFDRAKEVMGRLDSAISGAGTSGVGAELQNQNIATARQLLTGTGRAAGKQFEAHENALLDAVPPNFKTDMSGVINDSMSKLAELGVVAPRMSSETGTIVGWKLGDEKTLLEYLRHPEGSGALGLEAKQKLVQFINLANKYGQAGELKGKDAVQAIMNVRRGFDKFYFKATTANPDVKGFLTPISSSVRNGIVQQLATAGDEVATKYAVMNKAFVDAMPHVAEAERIARSYKGPETWLNQVMSDPEKNRTSKGLIDFVAGIKGKAGQGLADALRDGVAARDFVNVMPTINKDTFVKAGAVALGAHATGTAPLVAAGAIAASPLTSARLVGRTAQYASQLLPYAQHFGDFMKSVPPAQMSALVQSPQMFNKLLQTTVEAAHAEPALQQQLLQSHGVVPPGGPAQ